MNRKISGIFVFFLISIFFITGVIIRASDKESDFTYDIIIDNAKVFDGSLRKAFKADVAVKGDTIVKIAKSIKAPAKTVIPANGLYVCPGFIDLHTHVDRGMYFPENRACLNFLKQGVTSVVVGQCGQSAWPIFEKAEDQIKRWTEEGIGPNAALLVGHGTVREIVMGMDQRESTPEELEKMKELVKEAMEQGAYGFSTGLIYRPSRFSKTPELIELVKIIAPYKGIYHSHIRNENVQILKAIEEVIEIAKATNVPAHISHIKAVGKRSWGLSKKACALIEEARANGLTITADQYPYQFANGYPYQDIIPGHLWRGAEKVEQLTSEDIFSIFDNLRDKQLIDLYSKITSYYPLSQRHKEFLDQLPRKRLVQYIGSRLISTSDFQGPESTRERMLFLNRLNDPEEGEKIRKNLTNYINFAGSPENIMIGICVEKELEGKSLKEAAAMKRKSIADTAIELDLMGAKCIPFLMCEEDIEYFMKKDYVATGSDGTSPFYGIGLPHIRSYSTFLHKIKKYALQRKTVPLPHVIRSQTSLPAQIMSWEDRGWVKEGYKADIVVFDLKDINTKTSISNPHQYSMGVKYLFVNGEKVLKNGKWTGKLPGRIIKPS